MKRKLLFIFAYPLSIIGFGGFMTFITPFQSFGTFSYIGIFYLLSLLIGGILWVKYVFDLIRPKIVK